MFISIQIPVTQPEAAKHYCVTLFAFQSSLQLIRKDISSITIQFRKLSRTNPECAKYIKYKIINLWVYQLALCLPQELLWSQSSQI